MRLDPLRDIGTETQVVLRSAIAPREMHQINRADDVPMPTVIEEAHQNGIRARLEELKPERGDASVYRTRDLVPAHLMPQLMQGKVLVTNWHVFEPKAMQTGGVSAKVEKRGKPVDVKAKIIIGRKTTTARGKQIGRASCRERV